MIMKSGTQTRGLSTSTKIGNAHLAALTNARSDSVVPALVVVVAHGSEHDAGQRSCGVRPIAPPVARQAQPATGVGHARSVGVTARRTAAGDPDQS